MVCATPGRGSDFKDNRKAGYNQTHGMHISPLKSGKRVCCPVKCATCLCLRWALWHRGALPGHGWMAQWVSSASRSPVPTTSSMSSMWHLKMLMNWNKLIHFLSIHRTYTLINCSAALIRTWSHEYVWTRKLGDNTLGTIIIQKQGEASPHQTRFGYKLKQPTASLQEGLKKLIQTTNGIETC